MNMMLDVIRPLARGNGFGFVSRDFDDLLEGFFAPQRAAAAWGAGQYVPELDVLERDKEYVVRVDLPGMTQEDIDVTLEDGRLTIAGQHKAEDIQADKERYLQKERRHGSFVRSLQLGKGVNAEAIKARFANGVLELTLPKADEVLPKRIEIDVA
jgi:HSP20 family protein